MSDKLRELIKQAGVIESETDVERPSVVDRREAFMLDFESVNGNRIALPYSSLLNVAFNPSTGIVAKFSGWSVSITGINLGDIYSGIVRRSVGSLRATGTRPAKDRGGSPIIHKIEVTRITKENRDDGSTNG